MTDYNRRVAGEALEIFRELLLLLKDRLDRGIAFQLGDPEALLAEVLASRQRWTLPFPDSTPPSRTA